MLYSDDGITWNPVLGTQFSSSGSGIAYGGGKFVAVGSNTPNTILYSDS
jgi:hypothetical protein